MRLAAQQVSKKSVVRAVADVVHVHDQTARFGLTNFTGNKKSWLHGPRWVFIYRCFPEDRKNKGEGRSFDYAKFLGGNTGHSNTPFEMFYMKGAGCSIRLAVEGSFRRSGTFRAEAQASGGQGGGSGSWNPFENSNKRPTKDDKTEHGSTARNFSPTDPATTHGAIGRVISKRAAEKGRGIIYRHGHVGIGGTCSGKPNADSPKTDPAKQLLNSAATSTRLEKKKKNWEKLATDGLPLRGDDPSDEMDLKKRG